MNATYPGTDARDAPATPGERTSKPAADQNPAPEPSTEDQVDIANRVQKGIRQANDREPSGEAGADRSPAMDGNPAPERDAEGGVLKPADDTPAVLPKRSGPVNP